MGVTGRLRDMSLVDIVHIFHTERKTVAIHLSSEMGYGRIYLKEGNIIHASYRNYSGKEAVFQLLTWNDGEFEVEPEASTDERTIQIPVQSLILEGLRMLDEKKIHGGSPGGYTGDLESVRLVQKLLDLGILEKIEKSTNAEEN